MAKRTGGKASVGWRPDDIEILNVRQWFPDEKIDALAAYLPEVSDMTSFRIGVLGAAGFYRLDLHYRLTPTPSQRKEVLAELLRQSTALEQAIGALDLHSLKALRAAADEDPRDPGLEPPDLTDPGRTRVRCAVDSLKHLQRWAATAIGNTKTARGRPRQDDERKVVAGLARLWNAQSGQAPRPPYWHEHKESWQHCEFRDFCRAVLQPVLERVKGENAEVEPLDLTKAVQEVLRIGDWH